MQHFPTIFLFDFETAFDSVVFFVLYLFFIILPWQPQSVHQAVHNVPDIVHVTLVTSWSLTIFEWTYKGK